MKKNFFYSVMAVFTLLFMAACSQEEIISSNETNGGKVVLSVNVSGATPDTRAVADVQGYVMRCIMEAVDSEGTVIEGTRMVQPVTAGKATFEFEKNADAAQGTAPAFILPVDRVFFHRSGPGDSPRWSDRVPPGGSSAPNQSP